MNGNSYYVALTLIKMFMLTLAICTYFKNNIQRYVKMVTLHEVVSATVGTRMQCIRRIRRSTVFHRKNGNRKIMTRLVGMNPQQRFHSVCMFMSVYRKLVRKEMGEAIVQRQ